MMTDEALQAIKSRAEAATKGPWEAAPPREGAPLPGEPFTVTALVSAQPRRHRAVGMIWTEDDADFMAHAREDIPALVTALEDALTVLREARSMLPAFDGVSLNHADRTWHVLRRGASGPGSLGDVWHSTHEEAMQALMAYRRGVALVERAQRVTRS